MGEYPRVAALKTAADFLARLEALGVEMPFEADREPGASGPLGQPYRAGGLHVRNRWAVLPMEGWDGTPDGRPSEATVRRWRRFGASGAGLVWGGEAVAVRPDGRANPNQLVINRDTVGDLAGLREALAAEHAAVSGDADGLLVGLQLTHSGRFCRPRGRALEPAILYRHPVLDRKFGLAQDHPVMDDDAIARLVEDFVEAARWAREAGFAFVDVKHCHGYLGHEFLSAVDRPGRYGGSFENRTRFLREVAAGIRAEVPGLELAVRFSAADLVPYRPGAEGTGEPDLPAGGAYPYAFGGDGSGLGFDLAEPRAFMDLLAELRVPLVCVTLGSPYYNPHIQRPALFPPSDGYQPPEDPLAGVARQIVVTAALKRHRPELAVVGSGYSYLQEWLPHVGQAVVRGGAADFIGIGRMVLSYPELPADALAGRPMRRKQICRTFSDCTTAPRNGLVSGCYPLDPYYKSRPEAQELAQIRAGGAARQG